MGSVSLFSQKIKCSSSRYIETLRCISLDEEMSIASPGPLATPGLCVRVNPR